VTSVPAMKLLAWEGIPKAKMPEGTERQVTSEHLPCRLYPAYHALLANQIRIWIGSMNAGRK
jgi:hypothetical protein